MNEALFQVALTGAASHFIEFLKGPRGPRWIRFDTARVNRIASWAIAAVAGLGVTASGSWDVGWQISIPPANELLEAATRVMISKQGQQLYYKLAILGPVRFSPRPSSYITPEEPTK